MSDLPNIDPGTVPPLTGPGVVAGVYTLRSSEMDASWYLSFWEPDTDFGGYESVDPAPLARLRVSPSGSVWTSGMAPCSPALRGGWDRLRRRLESFHVAHRAKSFPQPLTEQQLRTWLRELNLRPREAQETT